MNVFILLLLCLVYTVARADPVCNSIPTSFPEHVQTAAKSVVTVTATYVPQTGAEVSASASGFVVSVSGRVATNYHVIQDFYRLAKQYNDSVSYRIMLNDCSSYEADVVFTQMEAGFAPDLALLDMRSAPKGLAALEFEIARPRKGEVAYAIGTPYGQNNTIVSGTILTVTPRDGGLMDSIHATTSIQDGNSGGALVNNEGKVLGMTYGCDGFDAGPIGFVCVRNGYFIPSVYLAKWVNFLK